jgi:hypothetical protein
MLERSVDMSMNARKSLLRVIQAVVAFPHPAAEPAILGFGLADEDSNQESVRVAEKVPEWDITSCSLAVFGSLPERSHGSRS